MIIQRMWENGPLRQFSARRETKGQEALHHGGFAGQYVCDEGEHLTVGLYRVKDTRQEGQRWLCAEHREQFRSKQVQPEALRNHRAKQEVLACSTES